MLHNFLWISHIMQSKIIINDFQLFIILGFDSIERKTKLIFIGLLKNENIEAFIYYNNLIFKRKL